MPTEPMFCPRQQIVYDDFPNWEECRPHSARRALNPEQTGVDYPYEQVRPLLWRTRAAVTDLTKKPNKAYNSHVCSHFYID